jgi:hypothetical protein
MIILPHLLFKTLLNSATHSLQKELLPPETDLCIPQTLSHPQRFKTADTTACSKKDTMIYPYHKALWAWITLANNVIFLYEVLTYEYERHGLLPALIMTTALWRFETAEGSVFLLYVLRRILFCTNDWLDKLDTPTFLSPDPYRARRILYHLVLITIFVFFSNAILAARERRARGEAARRWLQARGPQLNLEVVDERLRVHLDEERDVREQLRALLGEQGGR